MYRDYVAEDNVCHELYILCNFATFSKTPFSKHIQRTGLKRLAGANCGHVFTICGHFLETLNIFLMR